MSRGSCSRNLPAWRILFAQLHLAARHIPLLFAAYALASALQGMAWAASTLTTQLFFDAVTDAVHGSGTIGSVLHITAVFSGVIISTQLLNGFTSFLGFCQWREMWGVMNSRLHDKAARLDPICYEDPSLLDDINKAREGMHNNLGLLSITLSLFAFYLPYFLFMGFYLYTLKPSLVLAIMMVFLPVLFSQLIRSRSFTRLEDEAAPLRREYEYYERCIADREYFKDTRLLGAFGFFRGLYCGTLQQLAAKTFRAELHTTLRELSMRLITLLGYAGILLLLFVSLLRGDISVGAFAAVFASVDRMFILMEEIIGTHLGNLARNFGTNQNAMRFMHLPERVGQEGTISCSNGVRLTDVSFSYPGANSRAVKKVSLEIMPGETLAIVGENGSGKSTLVKLLTGIYLPDEGEVLIDGQPTRYVAPRALYSTMSAVFQRYQRYKMTLRENVAISDTQGKGTRDMQHALIQAELAQSASHFPAGLDTMLSREFGGVDISGGQWQRVAMARGFYRCHELIVLDEPTAAIDPLEETRIYKQFAQMAKGKTAVIVTHRLGSARTADRIVVMDTGSIAGIGTHDELMQAGGKYAELYRAQAQWYM